MFVFLFFAQSNHLKKQTSLTSPTREDPFGSTSKQAVSPTSSSNQNDLFGLDLTSGNTKSNGAYANTTSSASDDLLMLSGPNPFMQNIVNQAYAPQNMNMTGMVSNPFQTGGMMMSQPAFQQPAAPMNANFPMNPMFANNTAANNNKLRKTPIILVSGVCLGV